MRSACWPSHIARRAGLNVTGRFDAESWRGPARFKEPVARPLSLSAVRPARIVSALGVHRRSPGTLRWLTCTD